MVPHLVTALTGPINELEQRILESMPVIERWFRLEWMEHTPPFYTSVDIRNAGFKLAPVETRLHPDGWDHLAPEMLPLAVQAAMAAIEKICPEAKNLLLVPRSTEDRCYLSNLAQLRRIFYQAGLNVRIGSLSNQIKAPTTIELPDGASVTLEPLIRNKRRLGLKNFDPCTIVLNNDLSAGVPGILEELHEQYLLPPLHASWSTRRKSRHSKAYEEVAKRFGKLLGMDHWLIAPLFAACGAIDGSSPPGLDALRNHADVLLAKIRRKYKEYGINEKPFVRIKSDRGSGGVLLRDAKEIDRLAPALLARLGTEPGALAVPEILLQEGVPTCERINAAHAEPVVYLMDRYVVGGLYRVHAEHDADHSARAPGAGFVPLAFEHSAQLPQPGIKPGASVPNRFYMYGVIGRLAMLAASYELEASDPDAEHYD
ncbi:glutamate--cysteine ligase [Hydrogenophaga sp.]|uniref:glutamate--cysteine ligase n=1 Tax=Hydrogenophaga sp. TaxID=1904254 RepID=UPI0019C8145A|nr:glutamate--cysteine ligase [Hydrogenophaga sp.]MBD3893871.1 glutamate--cysteine ligase [Hydrogenophaga sp.]